MHAAIRNIPVLCVALALAAPVAAEPMEGAAARKALLRDEGAEAQMIAHPKLPEAQAQLLASVAQGQPHYGAVAFSPDDGLMHEATVAAVDFHSVEAAAVAAAADCDAKRKGAASCAVVAHILPVGWEPRAIQMSASAAAAFRKDYGRSGRRAMALSPSTGKFGVARGGSAEAEALATCNADLAAADCVVQIAD